MMDILQEFCKLSGKVLNPANSQIFFSKLIDVTNKQNILGLTDFKEGFLSTTDMGAPLM